MNEPCSANPTCPFLKAAITSMQFFTGLGPNFVLLKPCKRILAVVKNCIVRSLWEFLHTYGIQIQDVAIPVYQFNTDEFIMKRVFSSQFTASDIKTFNYCRLYLQVSRLAALITIDGKRIQSHICNGTRVPHILDTNQWFEQPSPSGSAWTIFRKILMAIYHTNNDGIFDLKLQVNAWNKTNWKWFYCTNSQQLYERTSSHTT